MKKIFSLVFIILLISYNVCFALDMQILQSQQQALGISDFIDTSNKYAIESFEDINMKNIFSNAITGRIGNTNIFNNILNILGRETKTAVSNIRNNINCNNSSQFISNNK